MSDYISDPAQTRGLVAMTERVNTERFHLSCVPIVEYEALYNDVLYIA